MRKYIVAVLLTIVAPMALAGHHLNGTWKLDVNLSGQGGVATFVLNEGDGGVLSGTYTGLFGTSDVEGTVNGADVTFGFNAQGMQVTYTGKFENGKLSGKVSYGDLGEGTFAGGKAD